MAPVLKTGRAQALVGSNPTPSALAENSANLPGLGRASSYNTLEIRTRFDWRGALRARVLIPHLRLLNEFQKEHAELENQKDRNADLAHRVEVLERLMKECR